LRLSLYGRGGVAGADSRYDNSTTMAAVNVERMLSDRAFLRTRFQYRYWAPHFVGGFDEGVDEDAKVFFWNGFDGHAYDHNVFIEPQFNWRSDRVKLVAGATYERIRANFTEDWTGQFGFDFNTFRFSFYEQFRSYETGELINRDAWITDRQSFIDGSNTIKKGGYALVNAGAQIPFGARSRWSLQVNATNLLNLDYYYYLGYLEVREAFPGQPIQVGATLRDRWQ
jgi:hypothetical protein